MHDASLPPGQRFSPDYYRDIRYVIDPQTGRIVEEGTDGKHPLSVTRYGNLSTAGLPGANGPGVVSGAPSGAASGVQEPSSRPREVGGGAGAEGRVSSETPATASGDIDAIGGYSTIGTGLGMLTGLPGLGMVGSAVDTVIDKNKAEEFDPEYEGNIGKWGSAFINDLTGGLLGTTHREQARDDYRERTGTGLNDAALDAALDPAGRGYSGPKGVVGDRVDGNATSGGGNGGKIGGRSEQGERSQPRDTSSGRRGARDTGTFGGGGGQVGESGGGGSANNDGYGGGYNSGPNEPGGGWGQGGGAGSGGGGGSSRVICTELYRQGKITREDWKRDLTFTALHLTPQHVRGYHWWACDVVKALRRGRWVRFWTFWAQHRANEIAYQMGEREHGDWLGKAFRMTVEPACWVIGAFVGATDWRSLYREEST